MKKNILLLFSYNLRLAKDKDEIPITERTIIIYMAADNDLSADAYYDDIEEMKQGFSGTDANLIVFDSNNPFLRLSSIFRQEK
jgi:hypothetical protein